MGQMTEVLAAIGKTVAAADLDAALVRCLTSTVGTDEDRARAMVEALAEHWPAAEPPRGVGSGRGPRT